MKTREELIDEMAKAIYATGVALDGTDYAFGVYADDDHFHKMANALCAAGYRKQSDTVREFVERLKQSLIDLYPEKNEKISLPDLEIDGIDIEMTINELAAEYGAEVEE